MLASWADFDTPTFLLLVCSRGCPGNNFGPLVDRRKRGEQISHSVTAKEVKVASNASALMPCKACERTKLHGMIDSWADLSSLRTLFLRLPRAWFRGPVGQSKILESRGDLALKPENNMASKASALMPWKTGDKSKPARYGSVLRGFFTPWALLLRLPRVCVRWPAGPSKALESRGDLACRAREQHGKQSFCSDALENR